MPGCSAASHGLPAVKTGAKRDPRRRLAFQPAAADISDNSDADGGQTLRRTVEVPSDLATLTAGGSGLVRLLV